MSKRNLFSVMGFLMGKPHVTEKINGIDWWSRFVRHCLAIFDHSKKNILVALVLAQQLSRVTINTHNVFSL